MEAVELESAAGVAADDDGGTAPKLNGDGAPGCAVKENPELLEFAVDRAKQNPSTLKLNIINSLRSRVKYSGLLIVTPRLQKWSKKVFYPLNFYIIFKLLPLSRQCLK